jgi:hypothetical protein
VISWEGRSWGTFDPAHWRTQPNGSLAFTPGSGALGNNGEMVLEKPAFPGGSSKISAGGNISATLVFPSASQKGDPSACAGFLVGGLAGSFHPGPDHYYAWEVSLSPHGYLRLGFHDDSFKVLKQVKASVPLRTATVLSVSVQPTGSAGVNFVVSVDGTILMRFADTTSNHAPGPAVALRSYDVAVTYSNFTIDGLAPDLDATQKRGDHRHAYHTHSSTTTRGGSRLNAFAPGSNQGMETHGVNNGEALKEGAVRFRLSGNSSDALSSHTRMELLDQYHGAASGIFSCDEHLAGRHPSHGTELCTVVEAMYSFETMFSIHGDAIFAERAERLAYNALPAELTEDMWAHQYLQQPNAIIAASQDEHFWETDGPDATTMNLEPNFPCASARSPAWSRSSRLLLTD